MALAYDGAIQRLIDAFGRLPGIGPARARSLEKLGLATVEDLLRYFPRDYEDRRRFSTVAAAPVDTPVCLELLVAEPPHLSRIRKGLELVKARLVDDTGSVTATFFNQSYMKDALRTGETYVVYGRVEGPPGRRQMTNPVCERADRARFTGRILPIYPLTRGISNNLLAGLTLRCVEECAGQMEETLPAGLRREHALAAAEFACRNIHFPRDEEALELARRRLIFEELFCLACGMALLRTRRTCAEGVPFSTPPVEEFLALLPFSLTAAQRRAMEETARDLASGRPMNRLGQGDVGSGKTTVAAWIKEARDDHHKTFKAVLPNCTADHEGIINLTTDNITSTLGTTAFTTAEYCCRIAGVLAGLKRKGENTKMNKRRMRMSALMMGSWSSSLMGRNTRSDAA